MNQPLRRTFTAAALALTLTPVAALALRPRLPDPPATPPGFLLQRLAHRLELTSDQVQAIRAVLQNHAPELREEALAIAEARRTLFATVHAESFDEIALRAAAAAVGEAEAELAVTRAGIVQEVRAVLTEEQQEELAELRGELEERLEDLLAILLDRLQNPLL
jgi:Spy/CpxP family protein refolding chaperone